MRVVETHCTGCSQPPEEDLQPILREEVEIAGITGSQLPELIICRTCSSRGDHDRCSNRDRIGEQENGHPMDCTQTSLKRTISSSARTTEHQPLFEQSHVRSHLEAETPAGNNC